LLASDARFELVTPRSLALLCFCLRPADAPARGQPWDAATLATANLLTKQLEDTVNARGIYVVHTELRGQYVVRFVPGSPWTTDSHIQAAWATFQQAANDVLASTTTTA
jgi:aromatic-L-amino-acid/L-tryptophan decarboxylase